MNPHEGLDISCSTDAVSYTSSYWVHLCYYELSERNHMAWAMQEIHNIKQICRNFWSCVHPNKTKYPTEGWRQVLTSQPPRSLFPRAVLKATLLTFLKKGLGYPPSGEDAEWKRCLLAVLPTSIWSYCSIVVSTDSAPCFSWIHFRGTGPSLGESKPEFPITNGVSFSLPKILWKRALWLPAPGWCSCSTCRSAATE